MLRVLKLVYNSYPDTGSILILHDQTGFPSSVAFETTTMFRDIFSKIYDEKAWGGAGGGSGDGSTVQ